MWLCDFFGSRAQGGASAPSPITMLQHYISLLTGPSVETIATSGTFAAAAQGFAFPHMNARRVFFQAYGMGNEESIVQFEKSLQSVISTGAGKFSAVGTPSAADDAIAFTGTVEGGAQGIYTASLPPTGGAPPATYEAVAVVGQDAFQQVANPSIDGDRIAFGGARDGLAGIYAAVRSGVWGPAHTLVNASTPQPALPHLHPPPRLRCVQDASVSRSGFVAFFGSSCTGGGTPRGGVDARRMYRTRRASEHAVHIGDDASDVIAGSTSPPCPTVAAAAAAAASGVVATTMIVAAAPPRCRGRHRGGAVDGGRRLDHQRAARARPRPPPPPPPPPPPLPPSPRSRRRWRAGRRSPSWRARATAASASTFTTPSGYHT